MTSQPAQPTTNGTSTPNNNPNAKSNVKTKIAKSVEYKNHGNECVKKGDYRKAAAFYTEAIRLNKFDPVFLTNRALCYLKLKKYHECIEDCTIAIQLDEKAVKAYYRRMQAYEALNSNLDEALKDCETILKLEPKNMDALRSSERLKKLISAKKIKEKSEKSVEYKINEDDVNKNEFRIKETSSSKIKKSKAATIHAPWSKDLEQQNKFKQLSFVQKPPHLRSKEPLKRLRIDAVTEFMSIDSILNGNASELMKPVKEASTVLEITNQQNMTNQTNGMDHNGNITEPLIVPENFLKPKTTTQFHRAWTTAENDVQKAAILEVNIY